MPACPRPRLRERCAGSAVTIASFHEGPHRFPLERRSAPV
ncbi:hypothetical protein JL2886_03673 [Phaeobacter gallaeciensis]|uniref:Uncharacterized protein n=1 Tax=Phaeobacter gallaeciensis TaxID=60890 RepID=A0A1B0ZWH1_9RHOB|nr:hypothetical protein JL2886_03673 [Phaeobacter gallaeciensis]